MPLHTSLESPISTAVLAAGTPVKKGSQARLPFWSLILLCALLSAARWCTLNSLWGDSPRWIFEAYRAASGEVMYRDFAWQYPPLPLLLCAGAMRLFGFTFWSVQLLLDMVSAGVVLLTWDLVRRFLPKPLPFLTAAAMAFAGATNTSNFALFSLQVYTPAILIGLLGLLLVLREITDYFESSAFLGVRRLLLLALGAAICLLSKPEYIIGLAGALTAWALCDLGLQFRDSPFSSWLIQYTKVVIACFAPSVFTYIALAVLCGTSNLMAGVGGYGLAALSCPWWPTGLGLFGALAALGYGVLDAALLSLTRFRAFQQHFGSRYRLLWMAAAVSLLLTVLYLPFCAELPMFQGRITLAHTLTYFMSTGTILLPVMWFSILLTVVLSARLLTALQKRSTFSIRDSILLVTLSSAVLMSLRGLFNGTMSQLTLASVSAYPIWFIIGPYFLVRFLESADRPRLSLTFRPAVAPLPVIAVLGVFLALRIVGVLVGEVKPHYATIRTAAGVVRVRDTISPQVYAFIAGHAAPHEAVLDIAGGGGINVADRRPSPIFSTQFTALAPPDRYLTLDRQRLEQHPPRFIIASAGENFGATYGICMNTGCTFPSLVWRSQHPACDPTKVFPALEYIRRNYSALATFGDKTVYSFNTPHL